MVSTAKPGAWRGHGGARPGGGLRRRSRGLDPGRRRVAREDVEVTQDRAAIIHGAGARGLSPALRDGAPALVPLEEREGRCGWAAFFEALRRRRGAVALEEGAARIVEGEAPAADAPGGPGALAEARRFLRALRGG